MGYFTYELITLGPIGVIAHLLTIDPNFLGHPSKVTKNFRDLKCMHPEPYKVIVAVGFPLHKTYPYSLLGEDSSILGTWNLCW